MTTPKTRIVPHTVPQRAAAVFAGLNELNSALAAQGLLPHHSPRAAVADGGTANLAAVVVMANAMKAAFNLHVGDTDAHVAADATNPVTAPNATSADQTAANTLLNDIKAKLNAHVVLLASHRALLGAPVATQLTVATTDASDLATSKALAAALLLAVNRHHASGASLLVLANS